MVFTIIILSLVNSVMLRSTYPLLSVDFLCPVGILPLIVNLSFIPCL